MRRRTRRTRRACRSRRSSRGSSARPSPPAASSASPSIRTTARTTSSRSRRGGVWKTTNAGTTWTPVFDDEGSYSIGCVALDPKNPNVVWVGTGENNSQRSVGYGDGVYKSHRRRQDVEERRPQDERAHRQDPHRPARLGHRLRRGAGAALGAGRRSRALQDHRRRQDLEQGARHRREHRRHRRRASTRGTRTCSSPRATSAAGTSGRSSTAGPAAAIHRSADGGKTWKKVTSGLPGRRPRPHRPGDRADRPGHGLRHRRGGRRSRAASSAAPTAA